LPAIARQFAPEWLGATTFEPSLPVISSLAPSLACFRASKALV